MKTKELKKIVRRLMSDKKYNQMTFDELSDFIGLKKKKDQQMLSHILKEMEVKNKVKKDENGKYKKHKQAKITGILQGNQKGFAFLIPEDSIFNDDIFIAASNLNGALDKDRVAIRLLKKADQKRKEGKVVEILERGHKRLVGQYQKSDGYGFVVPDNIHVCKDIYIANQKKCKAKTGDKVVIEIIDWPSEGKSPEGKIIEVLGKAGAPGIDILSIIKSYDIPMDFSREVTDEVKYLSDKITDQMLKKRRDLRDERIFTIDGKDAKDFDDAVSIKKLKNGHFLLGVHIADVSYYVKQGSAIDKSARERGNSVYVVDRVVPMLPFRLSNKICSLVPGEDRLTFSCEMEITEKGIVKKYDIFKSVIRSKSRMTYDQVNALLNKEDNKEAQAIKAFEEDLTLMDELRQILHDSRRLARGAINFDFPEAKIILNDQGFPIDVKIEERLSSHRMIEEFMLVCNETIAEHLSKLDLPFIFRNHPEPHPEKLEAFRDFINRFGFKLGGSRKKVPTGSDFQKLLKDIEGSDQERVITLLMLRTMQQAVYEGHLLGHYALAASHYTHFTSPIRRYPDLMIHRYLSMVLKDKVNKKHRQFLEKNLDEIAAHSSRTERQAESIESDINKLKMTEYMTKHIGEVFEGRISGITNFGIFVALPNTIEGLVKLQDLNDDYYVLDPDLHQYVGERTKKIYRLGQAVNVKAIRADVEHSEIDFQIVD